MSRGEIPIIGNGALVTTSTGTGGTSDINLVEIVGTATAVGAGAVNAGTQRVISASDDPGVASVASIDTKTPALGAGATAASVPVNIASDQDVPVQGDTAHDVADAGAPVAIGGNARSTQATAVTAGRRVRAVFNLFGEIIVAGYNWATGRIATSEGDPLDQRYRNDSKSDTTNETATTHYYPGATGQLHDGYSPLSMSGKLIDGDGTLTLTLEVMDDEDMTSGDWIDVTTDLLCSGSNTPAYRGTSGNLSYTVTNGTLTFALKDSDFEWRYYRWVVVASGATNTVIIKDREKW